MPDYDKVIKGLEVCSHKVIKGLEVCSHCESGFFCGDCPYEETNGRNCIEFLAEDALELIKAQRETIDELISADKVLKMIVHCEECIFNDRCEMRDMLMNHETGYCSNGERRLNA